jgi:hypothetical protein
MCCPDGGRATRGPRHPAHEQFEPEPSRRRPAPRRSLRRGSRPHPSPPIPGAAFEEERRSWWNVLPAAGPAERWARVVDFRRAGKQWAYARPVSTAILLICRVRASERPGSVGFAGSYYMPRPSPTAGGGRRGRRLRRLLEPRSPAGRSCFSGGRLIYADATYGIFDPRRRRIASTSATEAWMRPTRVKYCAACRPTRCWTITR